MNSVLQSLKTQFAENAAITALVGDRCSFVIELQDSTVPYIAYNLRELPKPTKTPLSGDFELNISIVAESLTSLFTILPTAKQVMDDATTDFLPVYEGSSFPDKLSDDEFIIELNYNIKQ